MSLEKAKHRFETLGTAVKNVEIIQPEQGQFANQEILRVSFNGEPYTYAEHIHSIERSLDLKQVDGPSGFELNSDKMPVLYYALEKVAN